MITKTLIQVVDGKAWATPKIAQTLARLAVTRKGGFARVYGYEAKTGRTIPQVYDATVTTRFSYAKLNERKRVALQAMTLADLVLNNPKLSVMSTADLELAFADRKQKELNSIEATATGNRDDAHRQGHDRCYISIADGITVHLATVKDADGLMQPVLTDGFPTIDSVMLNCLEVSRNVRIKGEYKAVNSGVPVLIGNAIKARLKAVGVRSMNRVSLKDGSFERVAIDGNVVLSEDLIALA